MYVDLDHPANAGIIAHWKARRGPPLPDVDVSRSPDSFEPYDTFGTHPDVVERLWREITVELPEPCEWVVYRSPVLVHPRTGIIFGWAGGTHTYALRLPPQEFDEALAAGAKRDWYYGTSKVWLHLADFGDDWLLGGWFKDEPRWCLEAYRYSERLGTPR